MSMKLIAISVLLLVIVSVQGALQDDIDIESRLSHAKEWTLWKDTHKRSYETEREELDRHLVWLSNKKYIDLHNANAHIFGFTLAMNQLGDLTDAEYMERHTITYSPVSEELKSKFNIMSQPKPHNNITFPETLDWRTKGAVGYVKNQLLSQCCSSYAFSAIATLEGAWALAHGNFRSLSEQNIIDCSVPYGNNGCSGGNVHSSFMYIIANDGVSTESSYSYKARQDQCDYSSSSQGASMSGIVNVKSGDEDALLSAVNVGPVSVYVDASSKAFRYYYSGVFDSSQCSSSSLNHAMVITGYGILNNRDYWLLKNSWGDTWGANGYILMSRDKYNQCGIATAASYPTL